MTRSFVCIDRVGGRQPGRHLTGYWNRAGGRGDKHSEESFSGGRYLPNPRE